MAQPIENIQNDIAITGSNLAKPPCENTEPNTIADPHVMSAF